MFTIFILARTPDKVSMPGMHIGFLEQSCMQYLACPGCTAGVLGWFDWRACSGRPALLQQP